MARINLYNYRQQELYYQKLRLFWLLVLTILLSLAINLLIYSYFQFKLNTQIQRNNLLTTHLEQLDQQIQPVYEFKRQLGFLSTRIQLLQNTLNRRLDLLAFLQQINKITPSQIYYSQVTWQGTQAELVGVTSSPLYLANFITKLRGSNSIFSDPVLKSSDSSDGIKHNFTITVVIKPNLVPDHDQ